MIEIKRTNDNVGPFCQVDCLRRIILSSNDHRWNVHFSKIKEEKRNGTNQQPVRSPTRERWIAQRFGWPVRESASARGRTVSGAFPADSEEWEGRKPPFCRNWKYFFFKSCKFGFLTFFIRTRKKRGISVESLSGFLKINEHPPSLSESDDVPAL